MTSLAALAATAGPAVTGVNSSGNGLLSDYVSEHDLADQLGVTLRTMRNWRSLGEGPPITRIGRRIYYQREAARAWLKDQQVEVA